MDDSAQCLKSARSERGRQDSPDSNENPEQYISKNEELIYDAITNWEALMDKIKFKEDMILPSVLLKDELGMDKWKNIPLPVVNASELFQKSLVNLSTII